MEASPKIVSRLNFQVTTTIESKFDQTSTPIEICRICWYRVVANTNCYCRTNSCFHWTLSFVSISIIEEAKAKMSSCLAAGLGSSIEKYVILLSPSLYLSAFSSISSEWPLSSSELEWLLDRRNHDLDREFGELSS